MRALIGMSVLAMAAAGGAQAATLEIREAAVRVTVIPEARSDVVVQQLRGSDKAPVTIARRGADAVITGTLSKTVRGCDTDGDRPSIKLAGFKRLEHDEMAELVVRTPMDVKIDIEGGATLGAIGRTNSLELRKSGCSRLTVANVAGRFKAVERGAGTLRVGTVGSGELTISGASDVEMAGARRGLDIGVSGAGDVTVRRVSGPLNAKVSGVGDIEVEGGDVDAMTAQISGMGEIDFGGRAKSLDATVSGLGEIHAREVTGQVNRRVSGGGKIRVG